jgi:hypothetical protein
MWWLLLVYGIIAAWVLILIIGVGGYMWVTRNSLLQTNVFSRLRKRRVSFVEGDGCIATGDTLASMQSTQQGGTLP